MDPITTAENSYMARKEAADTELAQRIDALCRDMESAILDGNFNRKLSDGTNVKTFCIDMLSDEAGVCLFIDMLSLLATRHRNMPSAVDRCVARIVADYRSHLERTLV